jgi:tripartite-type tricarboxylate transporter receptor subunit TctC
MQRILRENCLTRRACLLGASIVVAAGLAAGPVQAQEKFPSKPIEVVTHAGAGGGTDISVRMTVLKARKFLKQDVTVVSKQGGSGAVAINYVGSKPADGYALMAVTPTHLATMAQGKTKYKFEDFVPLVRMTDDPQYLMVKKGKYASAKAMIEAAQKGNLKVGGTNVGGIDQISIATFAKKTPGGFHYAYVPYKGGAHIATALIGGDIDVGILNYSEGESQIQAGEIEPLVVMAKTRKKITPNTACSYELGVNVVESTVRGIVAKKGTPKETLDILNKALLKSMHDSVYQGYLKSVGLDSDSVAGPKEWSEQWSEMNTDTKEALKDLGFLK